MIFGWRVGLQICLVVTSRHNSSDGMYIASHLLRVMKEETAYHIPCQGTGASLIREKTLKVLNVVVSFQVFMLQLVWLTQPVLCAVLTVHWSLIQILFPYHNTFKKLC